MLKQILSATTFGDTKREIDFTIARIEGELLTAYLLPMTSTWLDDLDSLEKLAKAVASEETKIEAVRIGGT
ncbi:MAG: hypothetical protein HUU55_21730 [Myxococcales bacterium]|nr:hypothetical protein [Myxococcales bacterium]